ncbi:hypothetical protein M9H77_21719 [Catharanthus roseus]|uniref:Uncharacterized protein n=1 Tax=Catharanthus roseus TaxID=4058 RepID=A0ACC0ANV1_CATRO|nr:hypothetical protein M9H77_21719 [Catharanthus roseus]
MPTPIAHHGSTSQIWLPSHLKERRKTFGKHERWTPSSTDRVQNLKRGHRNKFWHLVINTSLNSKTQCTNVRFFNLTQYLYKQVTSPGIPARPPCATLAGRPLLTQPAKK